MYSGLTGARETRVGACVCESRRPLCRLSWLSSLNRSSALPRRRAKRSVKCLSYSISIECCEQSRVRANVSRRETVLTCGWRDETYRGTRASCSRSRCSLVHARPDQRRRPILVQLRAGASPPIASSTAQASALSCPPPRAHACARRGRQSSMARPNASRCPAAPSTETPRCQRRRRPAALRAPRGALLPRHDAQSAAHTATHASDR